MRKGRDKEIVLSSSSSLFSPSKILRLCVECRVVSSFGQAAVHP